MTTASSMLPPGKSAGAWRNKKTPPTATFMPSVFITKASNSDTSLTSPVAFLRKTPRPSSMGRLDNSAIYGPLHPASAGGVTHDMHHAVRPAVAFQGEPESVRPVDDPGELNRAVVAIECHALDKQRVRSSGDPQHFRLCRVTPGDLDDALGSGQVDAVMLGQGRVERLPVEAG